MDSYKVFGIYNGNDLLYIATTTESLLKKLNRYKRLEFYNEPLFKDYIMTLDDKNVLIIKSLGDYNDTGYDKLSREGMWIQKLKPKFNSNILYES